MTLRKFLSIAATVTGGAIAAREIMPLMESDRPLAVFIHVPADGDVRTYHRVAGYLQETLKQKGHDIPVCVVSDGVRVDVACERAESSRQV